MHVFEGSSGNQVWGSVVRAFQAKDNVLVVEGRGGTTLEMLNGVISVTDPRQRWVTSRVPAINPAFAIAEIVWILRGRRDAEFLTRWNSQYPKFAGLDNMLHGAYGHRLRTHFGVDQLERAYQALKNNPNGRQVVLQVWDAPSDLPDPMGEPVSADIPCNVCAVLKVRDGRLEWLQVLRSNDAFLGLPHNLVQWTYLQEVLAGWLGVKMGSYVHVAHSLHVYERDINNLDLTSESDQPLNTDSLAMSKAESDHWFQMLEQCIEAMGERDLNQERLVQLVHHPTAPVAVSNLLRIMAAEAARKRRWVELMNSFQESCSNPALGQLWRNWLLRLSR